MEYQVGKTSGNSQAFTNCVYLKSKSLDYVNVNTGSKQYIFKILEDSGIENNQINLNSYQRTLLKS